MKYNAKIWKNRHRHRSDISTYITHLTKNTKEKDSLDVLEEILNTKKIIGSSPEKGFIIGENSAVCFQDIPLYGVSQNSLHEELNRKELGAKIRYQPYGLTFKKSYVYGKGGRPVFYEQKEKAKEILSEEEWWRIVSFDLSNRDSIKDWTHEREWRLKGDFEFELDKAIILLPMLQNYKRFVERFGTEIFAKIGGVIILDTILS